MSALFQQIKTIKAQGRTPSLMMLGTSSSVGKSVLTAGFCRLFHQEGLRVSPFKSQNMSSISHVLGNKEISLAQAMQAEAAGREIVPELNPILLKPTSDCGSQVWIQGEYWKTLPAVEYYRVKATLWPKVEACYQTLAQESDLMMIEGAGSPAEINLRQGDFVNLGLAERLQAPCLLIGDIDRGGVFASLHGTIALTPEPQRKLIKGMIINKFRGDVRLLEPAFEEFQKRCGIPVLGVLPMLSLQLTEEDSLSAKENGGDEKRGCTFAQREESYDLLAQQIRENLDLDKVLQIICEGA